MINQLIPEENQMSNVNEQQNNLQNSIVKQREETLDYYKLINQVEQEYYYKIQGCSVKVKD